MTTHALKRLAAAMLLAAAMSMAQSDPAPGTVSGRIVDADGAGISGMVIMATVVAVKPGESNPGTITAVSGPDGSFQASMPAGEFNLCAYEPNGAFVNPCVWTAPTRVNVATGQSTTGVRVQVDAAGKVRVKIRDTDKHISRPGKSTGHKVLVGIASPRVFVPASIVAAADNDPEYEMLVPVDKDVSVYVGSDTLLVADDKGKELKRGGDQLSVRVGRGEGRKTVDLAVTGIREP